MILWLHRKYDLASALGSCESIKIPLFWAQGGCFHRNIWSSTLDPGTQFLCLTQSTKYHSQHTPLKYPRSYVKSSTVLKSRLLVSFCIASVWELIGRENNFAFKGWNSTPIPLPVGREEDVKFELIMNNQRKHCLCLYKEDLIITQRDIIQGAFRMMKTWRLQDNAVSRKDMCKRRLYVHFPAAQTQMITQTLN